HSTRTSSRSARSRAARRRWACGSSGPRAAGSRTSRGSRPRIRAPMATAAPTSDQLEPRLEEIVLHGHRVSYRTAGSGPVVLLVHGIAGNSDQWDDVFPLLAEH